MSFKNIIVVVGKSIIILISFVIFMAVIVALSPLWLAAILYEIIRPPG